MHEIKSRTFTSSSVARDNFPEIISNRDLTSDYTTKPQSSRQYGTGTKTEI